MEIYNLISRKGKAKIQIAYIAAYVELLLHASSLCNAFNSPSTGNSSSNKESHRNAVSEYRGVESNDFSNINRNGYVSYCNL